MFKKLLEFNKIMVVFERIFLLHTWILQASHVRLQKTICKVGFSRKSADSSIFVFAFVYSWICICILHRKQFAELGEGRVQQWFSRKSADSFPWQAVGALNFQIRTMNKMQIIYCWVRLRWFWENLQTHANELLARLSDNLVFEQEFLQLFLYI